MEVPEDGAVAVGPAAPSLIAFYLPQFHPTPENDAWWGAGFTEWTNTVQARPLYRGHPQPHLPSSLGFYDLRVPEVQVQQSKLAREAGLSALCYYHYWFNGRRMLDTPLRIRREATTKPDLPYLLCWANESWTRTWSGGADDVLLKQDYSDEDDLRHAAYFTDVFRDHDYFRLDDGRPALLLYRSSLLPDPRATVERWRQHFRKEGIGEVYLCTVQNFAADRAVDPTTQGFDAGIDWAPHWDLLGEPLYRTIPWRLLRKLRLSNQTFKYHTAWDYDDLVDRTLAAPAPGWRLHPSVCPSWDNSPRKSLGSYMLRGATPEVYECWLAETIGRESREPGPQLVFVNAWNEWAEGCHLEPDTRLGDAWLQATRRAARRETAR